MSLRLLALLGLCGVCSPCPRASAPQADVSEAAVELTSTAELRAALERHPHLRTASRKALLSGGTPWQSAEIRVHWEAVWATEGLNFHSSPHESVEHLLVLDGASRERSFLLEAYLLGSLPFGRHVPWQTFSAALAATYDVVAAPDGHALAISSDRGSRWRYVALDAGAEPLFCPHTGWSAPPGSDVFRGAPTTRSLALDILAAADLSVPSAHRPPEDQATTRFESEFLAAARFACLHRRDRELIRGLVLASVQAGAAAQSDNEVALIACLQEVSRADPGLQAVFQATVASPRTGDERGRMRAADVLRADGRVDVQQSLAHALLAFGVGDGSECWLLSTMTYALARVTIARRSGGDTVHRALRALATGAIVGWCTPDDARLQNARADAVRGLGALAQTEPGARRVLEEIASGGCVPSPWSRDPLPAWSAAPAGAADAQGHLWSAGCWAVAALRQLPERQAVSM